MRQWRSGNPFRIGWGRSRKEMPPAAEAENASVLPFLLRLKAGVHGVTIKQSCKAAKKKSIGLCPDGLPRINQGALLCEILLLNFVDLEALTQQNENVPRNNNFSCDTLEHE